MHKIKLATLKKGHKLLSRYDVVFDVEQTFCLGLQQLAVLHFGRQKTNLPTKLPSQLLTKHLDSCIKLPGTHRKRQLERLALALWPRPVYVRGAVQSCRFNILTCAWDS